MTGLLTPLYEVVAWVVQAIHGGVSHLFGPATGLTWGLTILLLVVLVRIILFPLFVKQIHAQRKMADLAPQVQELRKKYKNDKQRMNQEVMKLYQENGANPLSGCLPLVLQFPVFISLFEVLRAIADDRAIYGLKPSVVASAQHARILGVTVATTFKDAVLHPSSLAKYGVNPTVAIIVVGITVIISGTTTYFTVRQSMRRSMTTTSTSDNPMMASQKYMGYLAPLFALSGLYWQYGLVMYWVFTNLWTMGQQRYIFKKYPQATPASDAAGQTANGSGGAPRKGGPGKGAAPAKGTGAAKGATPAKGAAAAKGSAPGKGGAPSKGGAARTGAPAGRAPAGTRSPSGRAPAGTRNLTGTSRADGGQSSANGQGVLGLGKILRRGQEPQEPEQAPEPDEEPRIVRRQPVRQSRSKRTGKG